MHALPSCYALGISGFPDDHIRRTTDEIAKPGCHDPTAYERCKALLLQELPEATFACLVAKIKALPTVAQLSDSVQKRELKKRLAHSLFENHEELLRLLEQDLLQTPFVDISTLQSRRERLLQREKKVTLELIGSRELEIALQVLKSPYFFDQQDPLLDYWYFYLASRYADLGDYEECLDVLKGRICPSDEGLVFQDLSSRIVSYIEEKGLFVDTSTIDSELICSMLLNPKITAVPLSDTVAQAFRTHAARGPRACGRMVQCIKTKEERIAALERLKSYLDDHSFKKVKSYVSLETTTSSETEPLWIGTNDRDDPYNTLLSIFR